LGDPQLNALASRMKVDNQTIARAEAAYRQARALVREQRVSLFPTVDLSGSASKAGGGPSARDSRGESYQVGIGASWEPDLWGRIRLGVTSAKAGAQASAADLAGAQLSAQGELAVNYLGCAKATPRSPSYPATVEGYRRTFEITQNRYNAGISPKSDVLQAQSQLANTQSSLAGLEQTRATYENAIAVLVGESPSAFRIAADPNWKPSRAGVPSACPRPCWSAAPTSPPPSAGWPPPTPRSAWPAPPSSRPCRQRLGR
jgi:outer membrane protein TolC